MGIKCGMKGYRIKLLNENDMGLKCRTEYEYGFKTNMEKNELLSLNLTSLKMNINI